MQTKSCESEVSLYFHASFIEVSVVKYAIVQNRNVAYDELGMKIEIL